jgi:hypothetical protein
MRGMRPALYDWTTWLAPGTKTIIKTRDYRCPNHSIIQQIRNAASKRGYRVAILDERARSITFSVQRRRYDHASIHRS